MNPLQMFDVNTINAGRQAGMQRGAVNSPFTPLGQALDKTLQKYDAHMAAQAAQNNAMDLQRLKNQGDMAVAGVGRQQIPLPAGQEQVIVKSTKDPQTGKPLTYSGVWDPSKGAYSYNHPAAMTPVTAKQEFEESIYKDLNEPPPVGNPIEQAASAQPSVIGNSVLAARAPSTAPAAIPPGYKSQTNRVTGETRIVPITR